MWRVVVRKRTDVEHTALKEGRLTCYLLERTGGGLRAWEGMTQESWKQEVHGGPE